MDRLKEKNGKVKTGINDNLHSSMDRLKEFSPRGIGIRQYTFTFQYG